jgi:hypothetical protein
MAGDSKRRRCDPASMSPVTKSLALGLALMNLVGEHVLRAAVETLDAQIK